MAEIFVGCRNTVLRTNSSCVNRLWKNRFRLRLKLNDEGFINCISFADDDEISISVVTEMFFRRLIINYLPT